jgi:hypothetical protein
MLERCKESENRTDPFLAHILESPLKSCEPPPPSCQLEIIFLHDRVKSYKCIFLHLYYFLYDHVKSYKCFFLHLHVLCFTFTQNVSPKLHSQLVNLAKSLHM